VNELTPETIERLKAETEKQRYSSFLTPIEVEPHELDALLAAVEQREYWKRGYEATFKELERADARIKTLKAALSGAIQRLAETGSPYLAGELREALAEAK
jgi:hypothetical protein